MKVKEMLSEVGLKGVAESSVQATLEGIPYFGIFASAVSKIKEGCLQKRFERWKTSVEERLSGLEMAVFDSLGDNETFTTALLRATELASKTNGKKVEYLANAVKYFAENETDEDTLIIMLNCIDKYTLSHVLILKYLENPSVYSNNKNYISGGIFTYFEDHYPKFNKQLRDIILKELYRDGMINIDSDATMSRSGMEAKRTTDLGDLFITIFGIEDENK